jgi:transposase
MSLNPVSSPAAITVSTRSCQCGCWTRPSRYPTDVTDAQWMLLRPLLPEPAYLRPGGGRPEKHCRRQIINALFYVVDNGIKWRALPADFPPWRTVYGFFMRWSDNLVCNQLTDRLRTSIRVALGRDPRPSAAVIDSQSVHACAEGTVGNATKGYDGHKRVNGRKRHLSVDVNGLLCHVIATPANLPDRNAAPALLHDLADRGVRHVWADPGYRSERLVEAARYQLGITLEITEHPTSEHHHSFAIPARRWVVERTHAWITRRRRCARDYERRIDHHEAWVYWAAILTMNRRLARMS